MTELAWAVVVMAVVGAVDWLRVRKKRSESVPEMAEIAGQHFDADHHLYAGPDYGSCETCGLAEECGVHQSYEQWSREVDEVFGR